MVAAMLPNRSIFRSRWKALFWSATVCLTALQFAGDHRQSRKDDADNAASLDDAVNALDLP